jgi:hypothetical protein
VIEKSRFLLFYYLPKVKLIGGNNMKIPRINLWLYFLGFLVILGNLTLMSNADVPTITCYKDGVAIVVDGDLSDWDKMPKLNIIEIKPSTIGETNGNNWSVVDDNDLTGQAAVTWDDEYFYVMATVKDDVHDVASPNEEQWWERDGVSYFFNLSNDKSGSAWEDGDNSFTFNADPSYPAGYAVWWRKGLNSGKEEIATTDVITQVALTGTDGDYIIEGAIPMGEKGLGGNNNFFMPPYEGKTIGFSVLILDADGAGTGEGWGQIMSTGDGDNQATWGNLLFSGTVTSVNLSGKLPVTWSNIKSGNKLKR